MQTLFSKDEREVLIRILSDVKINPLDPSTVTLVTIIQSIAKKVVAASSDGDVEISELSRASGRGDRK